MTQTDPIEKAKVLLKMYDIDAIIKDRSKHTVTSWCPYTREYTKRPTYKRPYVLCYGVKWVHSNRTWSGQKQVPVHNHFYTTPEKLLDGVYKLIKKSIEPAVEEDWV